MLLLQGQPVSILLRDDLQAAQHSLFGADDTVGCNSQVTVGAGIPSFGVWTVMQMTSGVAILDDSCTICS